MSRRGSIAAWRGRRSSAGLRFQSVRDRAAFPDQLCGFRPDAWCCSSWRRGATRSILIATCGKGDVVAMTKLTRTLLISTAFFVVVAMSPASAELDVAKLKASIETSVEADYPRLEALYKDI